MRILLLSLLFLTAGLRAEDGPIAALAAADDARTAAMRNPTAEALGEIFSDDLRYAHSSGTIDTKASFIEALVSGKTKYLVMDPIERGFTFPAPGVALMSGKSKIKVASAKGEMDLTLAYLAVWKEENGKWRFLAWQSCRLPDETTKP